MKGEARQGGAHIDNTPGGNITTFITDHVLVLLLSFFDIINYYLFIYMFFLFVCLFVFVFL